VSQLRFGPSVLSIGSSVVSISFKDSTNTLDLVLIIFRSILRGHLSCDQNDLSRFFQKKIDLTVCVTVVVVHNILGASALTVSREVGFCDERLQLKKPPTSVPPPPPPGVAVCPRAHLAFFLVPVKLRVRRVS
jgi:hypothetical protein